VHFSGLVAQNLCDADEKENDPSEEQDIVADAVKPRVGVAKSGIDLKAGIEIADR
jgi:hypothetical protein